MAANFITITHSDEATHASRILQVNVLIKQLREQIDSLVAEGFQMFDGEGAEKFTMLKIKYGVASNAEAQAVFDMLNGTKQALEGAGQNANAVALATQIG